MHLIITFILLILVAPASAQHDHENTTLIGRWPYGGYNAIGARDSIAFLGTGALLRVIDYTDPTEPEELSSVILPRSLKRIIVNDTILFIPMREYGLWVYDISDLTNPTRVAILDDVDSYDFRVNGQYLYEIHYYDGIYIYDISDPTNPTEVTFWDTEGYPGDIAFEGNRGYLLDNGIGLVILDISNPEEQSEIGRFPIDFGAQRALVTLDVQDNYVYIGDRRLRVLNVSNLDSIFQVSTYYLEDTKDIILSDQYAFAIARGLYYVFNIEDPYNLEVIASADPDSNISVTGICIDSNMLFGKCGSNGLRVYDISEPDHPTLLSHHQESALGIAHLTVSDNYAYCTDRSESFFILDISDLANPVHVSSLFIDDGKLWQSAIRGNYVYIADYEIGMRVIDVSDPTEPTEIGRFEGLRRAHDVVVTDSIAYLVSDRNGFSTIDITDPTEPVELDNYEFAFITDIEVFDNIALVTSSFNQVMLILDVQDPVNIELMTFWRSEPPHGFIRMSILNNYAYLHATNRFGTYVVDLFPPNRPEQVAHIVPESHVLNRSKPVGNYLYCTTNEDGVRVIDISNHQDIHEVGYYDTGGSPTSIVVVDELIFIGDAGDGLYIIRNDDPNDISDDTNISNPSDQITLLKSYPNPFNAQVTLDFNLTAGSRTHLSISDIQGRTVKEWTRHSSISEPSKLIWDASDISSGIYIAELTVGNSKTSYSTSKKLVLLR